MAQSDLRSLPSDEPWTAASQRGNDAELRLGPTALLDGGLRFADSINAASANPGALRRQSFDFAEAAHPGGAGIASAFQKAALEDCESAAFVDTKACHGLT